MENKDLDCPYDFTSRCTLGRCDCKPKTKWTALYMPGGNATKSGFATEEEAWAYVDSRTCDDCRKSGINACSAEWDVCTDEEWESWQKEE